MLKGKSVVFRNEVWRNIYSKNKRLEKYSNKFENLFSNFYLYMSQKGPNAGKN